MSTLPNIILPAAPADLFSNDHAAGLPGQSGNNGKPFDQVMTQALLGGSVNTPSPNNNSAPAQPQTASPGSETSLSLPIIDNATPDSVGTTPANPSFNNSISWMTTAAAAAKSPPSVAPQNSNTGKSTVILPIDVAPIIATTTKAGQSSINSTSQPTVASPTTTASASSAESQNTNTGKSTTVLPTTVAPNNSAAPVSDGKNQNIDSGTSLPWPSSTAETDAGAKPVSRNGNSVPNQKFPFKAPTFQGVATAVAADFKSPAQTSGLPVTSASNPDNAASTPVSTPPISGESPEPSVANTVKPIVPQPISPQNQNLSANLSANATPLAISASGPTTIGRSKDSKPVAPAQTSQNKPVNKTETTASIPSSVAQPEINSVIAQAILAAPTVAAESTGTHPLMPTGGPSSDALPSIPGNSHISSAPAPVSVPVVLPDHLDANASAAHASVAAQTANAPEHSTKTSVFAGMAAVSSTAGTSAPSSSPVSSTEALSHSTAGKSSDDEISKSVVTSAVNSSPSVPAGIVVADAKTPTTTPPITNGTPTAQQDEVMSLSSKTANSAELTGKFLPGSVAVTAHGNDLSARADQTTASAAANAFTQNNSTTATTSANASVSVAMPSASSTSAIERTHDLVAAHAMRLGDTGTDSSLQVVIKPAIGTQLSLQLRQHSGGVEAQAALQQGDYKHLSQLWPELQQRLEQRGIRLAPLADEGSFAQSQSNGSFHQKQDPTGETAAENTFVTPFTETFAQPAARAKSPSGWETWA